MRDRKYENAYLFLPGLWNEQSPRTAEHDRITQRVCDDADENVLNVPPIVRMDILHPRVAVPAPQIGPAESY